VLLASCLIAAGAYAPAPHAQSDDNQISCYAGFYKTEKLYYTGIFDAPTGTYGVRNVQREFERHIRSEYGEDSVLNMEGCSDRGSHAEVRAETQQWRSRFPSGLISDFTDTRWTP
jgi:hypothetical protein